MCAAGTSSPALRHAGVLRKRSSGEKREVLVCNFLTEVSGEKTVASEHLLPDFSRERVARPDHQLRHANPHDHVHHVVLGR